MEVYSPASRRLWRPAAQRQVRNAWSAIGAHRAAWTSASAAALSAAKSLVNACLLERYMGAMELGVLSDMKGIRHKARIKLRAQQEAFWKQLMASYNNLIEAVSEIMGATKSMRTYLRSSEGPLIGFSHEQIVEGDTGDGDGSPVFEVWPLPAFEKLAMEVMSMYQAEIVIKWLLASEFRSTCCARAEEAPKKPSGDLTQENVKQGTNVGPSIGDCLSEDELQKWREKLNTFQEGSSMGQVQREVLQVYLTAWLAEVHVNKPRLEEIFALVNEEMGIVGTGPSPKKL